MQDTYLFECKKFSLPFVAMENVLLQAPFLLFQQEMGRVSVVVHGQWVLEPDLKYRISLLMQRKNDQGEVMTTRRFVWEI